MGTGDIAGILWADATLDGGSLDYDHLVLTVTESTGRRVTLTCEGYIGLALEGVWDESVVETASLVEAHPFGERCECLVRERHGDTPPDSGSPARNTANFSTLVLTLIDGTDLLCCASSFHVQAETGPT